MLLAVYVAAAMSGVTGAASAATHGSAGGNPPVRYTVKGLGTLGGDYSVAVALDTHTVDGNSLTAGDAGLHAFAFSLRTGAMTDLGTLGATDSEAIAVDGRYVVGMSSVAGEPDGLGPIRAFAYDLATRTIIDMGTLGGTRTQVVGMAGDIAVGNSSLRGDRVVRRHRRRLRTCLRRRSAHRSDEGSGHPAG